MTAATAKASPLDPHRFQGALLGLATGDALGTTVEFEPPGSFTPVTEMTKRVRLRESQSISFSGGPIGLLQMPRSVVQRRRSGLPPRNCYSIAVQGILRSMLRGRRNLSPLNSRMSS